MVYYNYRHYNPTDGRWCGRDKIIDIDVINFFAFVANSSIDNFDYIGNSKRPSRNANRKGHTKNASRRTRDKHQHAQRHGGHAKPNFTPRSSKHLRPTTMNAKSPFTHPAIVGLTIGGWIANGLSDFNFFDEEIETSIVMSGPETCAENCSRLLVESVHIRKWTEFTWNSRLLRGVVDDISVMIEVEDVLYLRFACCNRLGRKIMQETDITLPLEEKTRFYEAVGAGFYHKIVEQWECL